MSLLQPQILDRKILWGFLRILLSVIPWEHNSNYYSGTPPYDHPVNTTTSLSWPYSFNPNFRNTGHFIILKIRLIITTKFLFPTVVTSTELHCILKDIYTTWQCVVQNSGRKNVLRKLLRIPYRRLKAGIFCVLTVLVCCWSSEWNARVANVCSL